MQTGKIQLHKKTVLRTVLIFLGSYLVFMLLWIQVKDTYAQGITHVASKIAAGIKGAKFERMQPHRDEIELTFSPLRQSRMLIDIPVKTSSYTFNAPLTFAIVTTVCPFIRRRARATIEVLIVLVSVHLLYVTSLETKLLTEVLTNRGVEAGGSLSTLFYEFLWSFTDNMVIRFEPFLIGFYMFLRFRR